MMRGNRFVQSNRALVGGALILIMLALAGFDGIAMAAPATPATTGKPAVAAAQGQGAPAEVKTTFDATPIGQGHSDASQPETGSANVSKSNLETPRVLAALAGVIGLIFLLRAGARRMFDIPANQRSSRAVQVVSRTIVAPKQHILLLQVGKRMIVVGDSAGQMNPLCQIEDPDEVAALLGQVREEKLATAGKTFGLLFRRAKDEIEDVETEEPREAAHEDAVTPPLEDSEGREILSTRQELSGLMEKVRLVSRQFHNGEA